MVKRRAFQTSNPILPSFLMKKAKIIALSLASAKKSGSRSASAAALESEVYAIFERLIMEDPDGAKFAKALKEIGAENQAKRQVLIDRLIDCSAVKAIDLDGDGQSELIIYFNGMAVSLARRTDETSEGLRSIGKPWSVGTRLCGEITPRYLFGKGHYVQVGGLRAFHGQAEATR